MKGVERISWRLVLYPIMDGDYGRRIRSDLESLVISLGMDGMIEIQVTEID